MLKLISKKSPAIHLLLLQDAPAHFAQVATWHHQECERQGLESSFAIRQQRLLTHVQSQQIPKTLVAVQGSQLIGCVSLVNYAYRADASVSIPKSSAPVWLSNLYVPEQKRQQGIGNLLIEAAKKYVRNIGVNELWLSASDYTNYYEKRGWEIARRTRLGGKQVNVMRIALVENNIADAANS